MEMSKITWCSSRICVLQAVLRMEVLTVIPVLAKSLKKHIGLTIEINN